MCVTPTGDSENISPQWVMRPVHDGRVGRTDDSCPIPGVLRSGNSAMITVIPQHAVWRNPIGLTRPFLAGVRILEMMRSTTGQQGHRTVL